MSTYLFTHIDEILTRIKTIPRIFLFLDYDGTLVPIAPRPDQALLHGEVRDLLALLCQRFTVAIITGRSLKEIKKMISISEIILAGNHGFEISSPWDSWVHPEVKEFQKVISRLAASLEEVLRPSPGAWVENKGLTLSVHYRLVKEEDEEKIKSVFYDTIKDHKEKVRVTFGKKVLEIRPNIHWDKGKAIERLSRLYQAPQGHRIYMGDDETDEDAFRALKEDTTILVGQKDTTAAKYWVKDPAEVCLFLKTLEKTAEWGRNQGG